MEESNFEEVLPYGVEEILPHGGYVYGPPPINEDEFDSWDQTKNAILNSFKRFGDESKHDYENRLTTLTKDRIGDFYVRDLKRTIADTFDEDQTAMRSFLPDEHHYFRSTAPPNWDDTKAKILNHFPRGIEEGGPAYKKRLSVIARDVMNPYMGTSLLYDVEGQVAEEPARAVKWLEQPVRTPEWNPQPIRTVGSQPSKQVPVVAPHKHSQVKNYSNRADILKKISTRKYNYKK